MQNIKLWSLFLPVVLCILNHEEVSTYRRVKQLRTIPPRDYFKGGFVGCLYEDLCLEHEFCFNDSLFGKCMLPTPGARAEEEIHPPSLAILEKFLKSIQKSKQSWRSLYVQCVVRTLLHHTNKALDTVSVEKLCGRIPSDQEATESFDETSDSFDSYEDKDVNAFRQVVNPSERVDAEKSTRFYTLLNLLQMTNAFNGNSLPPPESNQLDDAFLDTLLDRTSTTEMDPVEGLQQYIKPNNVRYQDTDGEAFPVSEHFVQGKSSRFTHNKQKPALDKPVRKQLALKRRYGIYPPEEARIYKPRMRSWVWTRFNRPFHDGETERYLRELSSRLHLVSPITRFYHDRSGLVLHFQVPRLMEGDAEAVVDALRRGEGNFKGFHVEDVGFGRAAPIYKAVTPKHSVKDFPLSLTVFFSVLGCILILGFFYTIHFCRRIRQNREEKKAHEAVLIDVEHLSKKRKSIGSTKKKQGLLQKLKSYFSANLKPEKQKQMKEKILTEGTKPMLEQTRSQPAVQVAQARTTRDSFASSNLFSPEVKQKQGYNVKHTESFGSQRSSTSSWSSEPVACGIDLTTGHLILSYMEGYLQDEDRLTADWNAVNAYTAEEATPCADAQKPENLLKNRIIAPLPYEQSRVRLRNTENDYINASLLYDHTPRNPVYIATPTPLLESLADFWEMVWEQSSVVIVCLERTNELKQPVELTGDLEMTDVSVQYWPTEGTQTYGDYEVHLVSEHSSCENYVVRSFYLKNMTSGETRTVTQFHYLSWTDVNLKTQIKPLLEFRRKVNRSFRGLMSPIVVHCIDGAGRTGTYILLDLVLSRIAKGVKEINIAASLEHLRDQRQGMVKQKEQYELVFTAVAKEVDAMLKATGQGI